MISLDLASGTRAIYLRRLYKGFSSKLPEVYPGRQIPEECRKAKRQKRCDNNTDEYIILNVNNI